MDCPRCGSVLERYTLPEREAVACEECGYIGVAADHGSASKKTESWTEALERFRDRE